MILVRIEISGEPVPLARPRFANITSKNGTSFVHAYNPSHVGKYQAHMRMAAQNAMEGKQPFEGSLSVKVSVGLPIPQSFSQRRLQQALAGAIRPITRPDLDNYVKQLDALNSIVWRDDSQIVDLQAGKFYSAKPGLIIEVGTVEERVLFAEMANAQR